MLTNQLKPKGLFLLLCLFFSVTTIFAQNARTSNHADNVKGESPYFLVKTEEGEKVSMPLIHTEAEVSIAGVIADVEVTQVYVNNSKSAIEAVYVFPGSSKSAVYGMEMQIGERVIEAKIEEKQKAKKQYEKAKKAGKSASLLEQHRPNVFQMNVANIMPGDRVEVTLSYNEILVPQEGVYEFIYPTVVGPRYDDGRGSNQNDWAANPHTNEHTIDAAADAHTFDINVHLESGLNLAAASCLSHDVDIDYLSNSIANIGLKNGLGKEGDRDFVFQYKLAGDQIESGLLLYEGENENFFLLMMQPPKQVLPEQIPAREYIFIVDVSGSMNGYPIQTSKKLMADLFASLRPEDKFNVLLFAGSADFFSATSVPANKKNIDKALALIDSNNGAGGTEILPALKHALKVPKEAGLSRTIVIATDGLVTVEKEAFDLIRRSLGEANFFPFGIGSRNNRFMIEGMAHAAQTEPLLVTNENQAAEAARRFQQFISSPVLTNIEIDYQGLNIYDVEPLSTPDIFAEKPVVVFGKYKGEPSGNIALKGISGNAPYEGTLNISNYKTSDGNSALKYLWARQKIMMLSDYEKLDRREDKKIIKEITQLGLDYNLLTDYTSFIAIDSKKRKFEEERVANGEPELAMSEGGKVPQHYQSNSNGSSSPNGVLSIGSGSSSSSGAVPEPHEWALIILLMGMTTFLIIKQRG